MSPVDNRLFEAVAGARETEVMELVRQRISAGEPAGEILAECNRGMVELGNRFAAGECYLPDLMFAGMIMKGVTAELAPLLEKGQTATARGTVVMGSVLHDVHDIGKDIVITMLRGSGFEVVDLGVDVPPEKFVEAIAKHKPEVVGMSVLLTTCFKSVIATVEAIKQAGQRERVSIMVGGAAASELLRENAGCDFYGKSAVDGVKFAGSVVGAA
jgi:methylmalonyl-CoA mutase cobalamin-binding domain/chain